MNDSNYAERYRTERVRKIVECQMALARSGYSAGRSPYGFGRWIVRDDGTQVRKLEDGERVRMAGHHVVWLPGAEDELQVHRRIIEMVQKMPASRIAATLSTEGRP